MLKRTPLYTAHLQRGGKLIEFGGWEMPVQYSSIVDEHLCVRRAAGIFDISHMGEVFVEGKAAGDFLNRTLTNDTRQLTPGVGQYTLMCNERGGTVDDLYLYRLGEHQYLIILNASRIEADVPWLEKQLAAYAGRAGVRIENASEAMGAVAVQGPRVREFIDRCFSGPSVGGLAVAKPTDLKKNQIARFAFEGQPVWVGRTGYTGEDGFEIVAPNALMEQLWDRLLAAGHPACLQPAGLGARDTLRTEMCYPLYGHELDEATSPIEAGLAFFVAREKGEFTGRAALQQQQAGGLGKRCVAFKMTEKSAPPRPGYPVWSRGSDAACAGKVVSGTQSPSLNVGIGMAYVPPAMAQPGNAIDIEIRGRKFPAEIVAKPIFRKPKL